VLGLAPRPDLTDDDVRAAWRRVAAASHPDRADGGDPAAFAEAAAAYTALRTAFGRGEALADRRAARAGETGAGLGVLSSLSDDHAGAAARLAGRIRRGRPFRLALRVAVAAGASVTAVAAAGASPAAPALVTGALTWLALTARHDLAPPC
jgi:curved DNA-binding protein CbpA